MGYSSYSADVTSSYLRSHKLAGTDAFIHTDDIKSGRTVAKTHEKLDPKTKNTLGQIIRESLDSKEHPNSLAVAVLFDVTGSMAGTPRTFIEKLPKLMSLLVKKGYIEDPHVLFGAIGDATCDSSPLQLGQFESGNELDQALSLIHLEGGGGGHITESYELACYYMARHTKMDCVDKRGKKGYLFLMGDELPRVVVNRHEVEQVIGDNIEANIRFSESDPRKPTDKANGDILAELREKFEVFWIMPGGTSNFGSAEVVNPLKAMFGQNFIQLDSADNICELIATTIGVCEGYDTDVIAKDLDDLGADKSAIASATLAVSKFADGKAVVKGAVASGDLATVGSDDVSRL